jgi:glucose/arabinose dehydrogenase
LPTERPRVPSGWLVGIALLSCGLLLALAATAAAEPALPEGFQDSIEIGNLEQPTSFRFAADGRVFVAERSGRILVFDSIDDPAPEVFADLRTDVYDSGDRGLLGMALDPKFTAGRPYVYALYTYDHILGDSNPPPKWGKPNTTGDPCPDLNGGDACLVSGRLVRLKAIGSQAEEASGKPVQLTLAEGWCQQFSSHSIGDLQFGPEGALYASGGDGASFSSADYGQLGDSPNPCGDPPEPAGTALSPPTAEGGSLRAQNNEVLNGKIIRVDPDTGQGWPGNPLLGNEASSGSAAENEGRIIAKGFRNPFRFDFDPVHGELYTDNVGSSEIEELDRFALPAASPFNSGWPCYEGPERQFQFKGLGLNVCEALYEAEDDGDEPTTPPFFHYSHGQSVIPDDECPIEYGSALGGISFYEGDEFPAAYKGALFFSDAVRGCAWVMFPGEDGRPDPETTMRFMREARVYPAVDFEEGPDGEFYYANLLSDEAGADGAIHRIFYSPGAPKARLAADPLYGTDLPLEVTFDASESSDPTDQALSYDWDMDGNGAFETEDGGETRSLEFTEEELEEREENEESLNRVVSVRVEDPDGNTSVASVTVYPGDSPPEPEIDAPLASQKWGVGDTSHLQGSAVDGQGNPMVEPLSYYWSTRLLHCPTGPLNCHGHPLQTFAGVKEGELIVPEHDYPSYLEITLRVADERGLTASKTIKLEPRAVNISIASSPPGIELTAGLLQGPSPLALAAIEGSHVLLSAPQTAQIGGKTYNWQSWSDGGERIHTLLTGASGVITATYAGPPETPTETPGGGSEPKPPAQQAAPKAKVGSHPPRSTRSRTARFGFAADTGGVSFKCKLDQGSYKTCRSPKTYKQLRPGRHTFAVVALATSGERGVPAKFSWKVLIPKGR